MIVDRCTYELQPRLPRPLRKGMQMTHPGHRIGCVAAEVSNVNEIAHLWAYGDLADRTRRRAAMAAGPASQSYLQKSSEFLKTMNNKILVPTSFSPTK
jgi:hypothetical protein